MSTFEQQLSRYAELAVKVGVNIQPNQYLYISASTETAEFVRLVTEKAYDAGARQVFVDWSDDVDFPYCVMKKHLPILLPNSQSGK